MTVLLTVLPVLPMLPSHEGGESTRVRRRRPSHPLGMVQGMCTMCEGSSQEEMLAADAAIIEEHGHLVTGVGESEPPYWACTVRLRDRVGHPELIMAGPDFRVARSIITTSVA